MIDPDLEDDYGLTVEYASDHGEWFEPWKGTLWYDPSFDPAESTYNITASLQGVEPGFTTPTAAFTLSTMRVDITSVPSILFASATYATPIGFEVQGVPADKGVTLNSIEVRFFAEGEQKFSLNQPVNGYLVARTAIGSGTALSELTASTSDRTFETFVSSSAFRGFSLNTPPRTGDARFEITLTLDIEGHSATIESSPEDPNASIAEMFVDKAVYAADMQDSNLTVIQAPPAAVFEHTAGEDRATIVSFGDQIGTYWNRSLVSGSYAYNCWEPYWNYPWGWWRWEQPVTVYMPDPLTYRDGNLTLVTWANIPEGYPAPVIQYDKGGYSVFGKPKVRNGIQYGPYGVDYSSDDHVDAYKVWNPHSSYDTAQRTYRSSIEVEQSGLDQDRGTYLSEVKGQSAGVIFYASYPGKTAQWLGLDAGEKAMDIGTTSGRAEIILYRGVGIATSDSSHFDSALVYGATSVVLGLGAGVAGMVPGGQPLVSPFATAASVAAALALSSSPSHDGTAEAFVGILYNVGPGSEDTIIRGAYSSLSDLSDSESAHFVSGGQDITVGDEFRCWMTIWTKTQLPAHDTYTGPFGHRNSAQATYQIGANDSPRSFTIKCYKH